MQKLKQTPEEQCLFLRPVRSLLLHTTQAHVPRPGITLSKLGPPASLSNQENAHSKSNRENSSVEITFSRCVRLTAEAIPHTW